VTTISAGQLAQSVGGPVVGRDDHGLVVDRKPGEGVGYSDGGQTLRLLKEVERTDEHEARQVSGHPRHEGARAELLERVVAAVRGMDVVGGLGAAVIAHHGGGTFAPGEVVDDGALARIAEA
jgi:hypothetical protein